MSNFEKQCYLACQDTLDINQCQSSICDGIIQLEHLLPNYQTNFNNCLNLQKNKYPQLSLMENIQTCFQNTPLN